jgi:hypothetical protein
MMAKIDSWLEKMEAPITNPNPIYRHSITWQYLILILSVF